MSKKNTEISITEDGCVIVKYDESGEWSGSWFFGNEHLTNNEKVFVDNMESMAASMISGEIKNMSKTEAVKEMTSEDVRTLAENIVSKTSGCDSDYDAIENVESALNGLLKNIGIDVKKSASTKCKCTTCACGKK